MDFRLQLDHDRPARCFPPRTTGVQFSGPPMNGPSLPRRRIAFTPEAMRRRGEKGRPPRLLNPSGAFNDPFYPQIRVKNRIKIAPSPRVTSVFSVGFSSSQGHKDALHWSKTGRYWRHLSRTSAGRHFRIVGSIRRDPPVLGRLLYPDRRFGEPMERVHRRQVQGNPTLRPTIPRISKLATADET